MRSTDEEKIDLQAVIEEANLQKVKRWLDDKNNKVDVTHLRKILEVYEKKKAAKEKISTGTNIVHIMYEVSLAVKQGRVVGDVSHEDGQWMQATAAEAIRRVDEINQKGREERSKVRGSNIRKIDELEQAIVHQDAEAVARLLKDPKIEIRQEHIEAIKDQGGSRPCMAPIINLVVQALIDGRHANPRQMVMDQALYLLAHSHEDNEQSIGSKNRLAQGLAGIGAIMDKSLIHNWEVAHRGSSHNELGAILRESNPEIAYEAREKAKADIQNKRAQSAVKAPKKAKLTSSSSLIEHELGLEEGLLPRPVTMPQSAVKADDQDFRYKLFQQERKPQHSPIIALGVVIEQARKEYKEAYSNFGVVGYYMNHLFTGVSAKGAEDLNIKISEYVQDYNEAWSKYDEVSMKIAEMNIINSLYKHLSRQGGLLSSHPDPLDDKSFDTFLIKKLSESEKMREYFGWNESQFKITFGFLSAIDSFLEARAPELALLVFRNLVGNYSGKHIVESQLGREWMRGKMIDKFQAEVGKEIPTPMQHRAA